MKKAIALVRELAHTAKYEREATLHVAPQIVNCFTVWQWAVREAYGIYLPERILSLPLAVSVKTLQEGDFVFTGQCPPWKGEDDWGHCGVFTEKGTVMHATRRLRRGREIFSGIREDYFSSFTRKGFLGARRLWDT
ncbi:MAG: hypothetical protein COV07_00175 [Candidatus Vogelbacteria bacterium CG10_big_fil_rev_8_21_14_0_10_45_14]|uniref:NlpC/P60 domain-containing protein n=1 Tax=Candidatus Vogelbacteria bacterium CG10_big_fil_rev_8_21_14_0_10_45_14 TaxID=1975042 RepID=A0A2H0RN81_9BACT|nr:MAG: hypothetical protein COV07_00175 [Candidatus Vogelbacteria bacterium CG10_big_fil_rev_8_21_14_0_10_45_14]